MEESTLLLSDEVYACSESTDIKRYLPEQAELEEFCTGLRTFENKLGDSTSDDYWKTFLRKLKRYRFKLCAAPLPFGHPAVSAPEDFRSLRDHILHCGSIYPDFATPSQDLLDRAVELSQSEESPLFDQLEKVIAPLSHGHGKGRAALLLKEPGLIPDIEKLLASHRTLGNVELVGYAQLRRNRCYDRLIIVGPARWYPEHVVTAPRAPEIHIIHYKWIRDTWKARLKFVSSSNGASGTSPYPTLRLRGGRSSLDADEIIPAVNWEEISANVQGHMAAEHDREEINARLFLLEGGGAVFLDVSENASSLVINMDADEDGSEEAALLQRALTSEIERGMYVLLRTEGGGDYIVPLADRILGEHASEARKTQEDWKARLRETVHRKGIYQVVDRLSRLSAPRAGEINVRNWMSDKNIKPQSREDFDAIGKLLQLESTDIFWENATKVDSAHRRAGQHIRKQLLAQVRSSDLGQLEQQGRMEFELPEADGGSITAFRVSGIAPELFPVAISRLGHLIPDVQEE